MEELEKAWENYENVWRKLIRTYWGKNLHLQGKGMDEKSIYLYLQGITNLWIVNGKGNQIKSLPQLLQEHPGTIYLMKEYMFLEIIWEKDEEEVEIRKINRKIDRDEIKAAKLPKDKGFTEIPQEYFWFLWEETRNGILDIARTLGSYIPETPETRPDQDKIILSNLKRAGMKLIPLPGNLHYTATFQIPFTYGDYILDTPGVKKYIETMEGIEERDRQKLLDLWKN